jgi:hypothetical protein
MAIHIPRFVFLGVAGGGWRIGGFSTSPEWRNRRQLSSSNRLLSELWEFILNCHLAKFAAVFQLSDKFSARGLLITSGCSKQIVI